MKKTLRIFLQSALVVMAMLYLATFAVADDGVIVQSDFNDGTMHWSISADGVLTISGTGDMPDNDSPWSTYNSEIVNIVVNEGITRIGDNAFNDLYLVETVSLPDSITELGASCFRGCEKLFAVEIPEGVRAIKDGTFMYCRNLTEVELSEGIITIGNSAFYMCSSLVEINIPDGVTTIDVCAFESAGLERVFLPASLERIGDNAFYQCPIEKVYYAGSRSSWNGIAFEHGNEEFTDAKIIYEATYGNAVAVEAVEPVNGAVIIDNYYIAGETVTVIAMPDPGYSLKTIIVNGDPIEGRTFTISAGQTYTVSAVFEPYYGVIASGMCGHNAYWCFYENGELYVYGNGEVSEMAWSNYRGNIESVVIDEGITSIANTLFHGCSALKSVSLPDTLTTIDGYIFISCNSLKTLELPASIETIGGWIFQGMNLDSLYFKGTISEWLEIAFGADIGSSINYFLECVDKFYISGELVENLVIPDGITSIPESAFEGYDGLKSVVIPASVTTIGRQAFSCSSLVYAEFLGDAPIVATSAFYGGDSFTIYYHENTSGWSSPLWDVYYAACVEEFSDYSVLDEDNRNSQGILFTLNESAKTAVVGDGSNTPNNSGYYGAQRGAVIIPDTVVKDGSIYRVIGIGPYAFSENRHVTSVSIGSGVTSILPTAFVGCPELKSITVSEDNEYYCSIDGVLYDVGALYLYVYPGGKTDESFTVPETVQTIGTYAFYDNEHIRTLTVGRNVTAIYEEAFCGLTNLMEITLPFIGTRERLEDDSYYYSEQFATVFGYGHYGENCLGDYDYDINYRINGSLKNVTILGGDIYQNAFNNCGSIEEINLPSIPNTIPSQCFYNCAALQRLSFGGSVCEIGNLVLPEGIDSIGYSAFYGCEGITSVTLPASLTNIESSVFSGAGVEEFAVAAGNLYYSTDEWGVLYNYDKTELIQYPSCRVWPYYNVADTATSIADNAFYGSSTLVNLYIPNTVTSISVNFRACPYLTICCYINSAAYRYALNNNLTAWYMDNRTLQGIRVYSLPEQTVQTEGAVNLAGLYIVGDYGGRELQIDNYTLNYDDQTSGVKTVTVEYMGKTATFEMVFYTSEAGNVISFRTDEDLDGKVAMIVVYNSDGAMLLTANAAIINGEAQIGVSDDVFAAADHAKLLILDESNYAPAAAAQEISV